MLAEEEDVAPPTPLALARLVCHFFRGGRRTEHNMPGCLAPCKRAYKGERTERQSQKSRCTVVNMGEGRLI